MRKRIMSSGLFVLIFILGDLTGACLERVEPRADLAAQESNGSDPSYTRIVNCTTNNTLYDECGLYGYCQVSINIIDNSTQSECKCDNRHQGRYCERRKRPSVNASVYAIAGVAGLVFIIIVLGVSCIIKIKRDKKMKGHMERAASPGSPNGVVNARPEPPFSLYSSPAPPNGDAGHERVELLEVHSQNGTSADHEQHN